MKIFLLLTLLIVTFLIVNVILKRIEILKLYIVNYIMYLFMLFTLQFILKLHWNLPRILNEIFRKSGKFSKNFFIRFLIDTLII